MEIRERLNELANNLYCTWHPEATQIFRDLDPDLWRKVNHNPVAFLSEVSDKRLDKNATLRALESRIIRATHILRDYTRETNTWGTRYCGSLGVNPVAYFSAEFGLHESLSIYSGGLGVLAGDHIKAASDLGVPVIGVGLLYQNGYFKQRLDKDGWQHEEYGQVDVNKLPLEVIKNEDGEPLKLTLQTAHECCIAVEAYYAQVGRCCLILLDTNVEENDQEIRDLTAQLYGGDNRTRIRQEFVLGVGGMRVLQAMGISPGVLHLNEGHSAFALLELARQFMERDARSFHEVREKVAAMTVFTTHTPVAAGHDRFDPELLEETLKPLRENLGLSEHDLLALGRARPDDEEEPFCMTVLGLGLSHTRNGVSRLHQHISRDMWHLLWPDRSFEDIPIGYVTNGVHISSWLATEMDRLYTRCMGEDWRHRMYDPALWEKVTNIDDEELWETNETLLGHLIDFVRRRVSRESKARGEEDLTTQKDEPFLRVDALTIGIARRFSPYKRCDLLLGDLDRLDALVNNPERPVQIIFAGKAHPKDEEGKRVIQRTYEITRDPRFIGKIVFIEDYDINVTRHLVQGVDLWLNTPRRPLEACGSSGMKAMLNGALNLSVLDGWWAEAFDGRNGFAIGDGGMHSDPDEQDRRDTESLFHVLENEVIPIFYERDAENVPREWVHRQKHALRTLAWRFSAQRMVTDYARYCYLPAVGGTTCSFAQGLRLRKT